MKLDKKKRLEDKGWRIGSAADFLGLSLEETSKVELRLELTEVTSGAEETIKK